MVPIGEVRSRQRHYLYSYPPRRSCPIEEIVTVDLQLRRFQYRVTGGDLPVEEHLGTIDVIELEEQNSILV